MAEPRSVIRPNPVALFVVIALALSAVGWYVIKMYKLEGRIQEMLEQQRSSPTPTADTVSPDASAAATPTAREDE